MSVNRKRIAIVGATSGIAEACARLWVHDGGRDFILYGRRADALDAIADDLRTRDSNANIVTVVADLTDPAAIDDLVARGQGNWPLEAVLIAFGVLPNQSEMQDDTVKLAQALTANAIAPALWAESFARASGPAGTRIAVIGSVAGDRGRRTNYAYGAAKGLVERYVEGLQHRFSNGGPVPILIKPGPTRTAMTAHMEQGKMATAEDVAKDIVAGIAKGRPVIYTPGKWAIIMTVIRNLPRWVFNKMHI